MDIKSYQEHKKRVLALEPVQRLRCDVCIQPEYGCYCGQVRKFDSKIEFVILIHPLEMRRRIATGRMSHLCLEKSHLISGQDFSKHPIVNDLICDTEYQPVILYPSPRSLNLSTSDSEARTRLFQREKKLRVFVIDGTWATAKKMMAMSQNLLALNQFCFTPSTPSKFIVRKQPKPGCYSTIEAIHQTIELLGNDYDFDVASRGHDHLLDVFQTMVHKQIDALKRSRSIMSYRRVLR
jgi:DTW domain-containing protein YfiP